MTRPKTGICTGLLTLLVMTASTIGQDIVVVSSERGQQAREGKVLAWAGNELILESNGREKRIVGSDVVRVETKWPDFYSEAEELFAADQYEQAAPLYQNALRHESRDWVQTLIRARLVQIDSLLGNHASAIQQFVAILQSDPETRFIKLAPLPWTTWMTDVQIQTLAESLAAADLPTQRLVGNAWLIGTQQRNEAITALEQLSALPDRNVAALARLQLWRSRVVTADKSDLKRLRGLAENTPRELRAPAWWLIGQVQKRLGQNEDAMLSWMKVPTLHAENLSLTTAALQKTAELLEQQGNVENANRIRRELATQFGTSD